MKRLLLAVMGLWLCMSLCGCDVLSDGHYASVTPHPNIDSDYSLNPLPASTYEDVMVILNRLMDGGRQEALIHLAQTDVDAADSIMRIASLQVMADHPIAIYTAAEITSKIGIGNGYCAIAVNITYQRNAAQLQQLQLVEDMASAHARIEQALINFDPKLILRIPCYENQDLIQFVQDYADTHPQVCIESPQVFFNCYPNDGSDRVVELTFSYQTNRESLRTMQQAVGKVFDSARLYISSNTDTWQAYSQLYRFLMERFEYSIQTSLTPSYHLLQLGVGDHKAFATVYAAMCRQVGLDCQVVSGAKNGTPWMWNVLLVNGKYYHVDLLACNSGSGFQAYSANQMSGYVWDYAVFPRIGS